MDKYHTQRNATRVSVQLLYTLPLLSNTNAMSLEFTITITLGNAKHKTHCNIQYSTPYTIRHTPHTTRRTTHSPHTCSTRHTTHSTQHTTNLLHNTMNSRESCDDFATLTRDNTQYSIQPNATHATHDVHPMHRTTNII